VRKTELAPNGQYFAKKVRLTMPARQLTLALIDDDFAICQLAISDTVPPWASAGTLVSVTRTADELSIVCSQDAVPPGVKCERGWRAIRVVGSMDFSAVGVLASLVGPLAEAGISIFALSTFDTDYLLVKQQALNAAVEALKQHGHAITCESSGRSGEMIRGEHGRGVTVVPPLRYQGPNVIATDNTDMQHRIPPKDVAAYGVQRMTEFKESDVQVNSFKLMDGGREIDLVHLPSGLSVAGMVIGQESSLRTRERLMEELKRKVESETKGTS
jgi:hypothetical protein